MGLRVALMQHVGQSTLIDQPTYRLNHFGWIAQQQRQG